MYTVLVAAMALHGVHYLGSSGTVDTLLPYDIGDTVWTVSCDGTFEVQYLNDFGGDFIISNNGNEESRVSGEHKTLITKSFAAHTNVTMTAHVKWVSGNKKVLFSWACDAVPAALPSTLNTAGNVSHLNYGPNEEVFWELQCAEDVRIMWSSFDIGNDDVWVWQRENAVETTKFNSSGSNIPEPLTFASTGYTYVTFTSDAASEHGGFAFRYECVANSTDDNSLNTTSPSAPHVDTGLVDTLLPSDIGDTVWTVSCDGTFTVQYLNDFGGDFIISNNGNEESRVSGEHKTLTTKSFAAHTNVTMTAHVKWVSGNKKVLFSWACDAVPAALPSTLNTAGNVSHLNWPDEKVYWELQCAEDVRITWSSFDIGNDDVWVWQRENGVVTTKFTSSGSNIPEPLRFASTGYTYVTFISNVASEHGGFAFRYECVANSTDNDTTSPSAPHVDTGLVDTLLPSDIGDTVWTVSCDGTFEVQYLNDFGGDFIISNNGNEESRVSGEHKTLTTKSFAAHTNVTMTAHVKWVSGNKKVLFSWACDAVPAALPSTLNTAGNVSHLNYGPNEKVFWELQCAEDVRITWTSFDIGNDELRWRSGNDAEETLFHASPGSNLPETSTIASNGATYVTFTSNAASEHGGFAFRYECVANSTDDDSLNTTSPSAPHVDAGLVDTPSPSTPMSPTPASGASSDASDAGSTSGSTSGSAASDAGSDAGSAADAASVPTPPPGAGTCAIGPCSMETLCRDVGTMQHTCVARPASCCSDTATCEDGETASDAHCTTDEAGEGVCRRNAVCCSEVFCRAHASDSAPKWWVWVLLAVGGVLLLGSAAFAAYHFCAPKQKSIPDSPHYTGMHILPQSDEDPEGNCV